MAPSRREPDESPASRLVSEVRSISADIVACGLVDLDRRDFLSLESEGAHPREFLSYLAMTTAGFFEGDATRTIQSVLDEAHPERIGARDLEEITMRSTNNLHVMVRLRREPRLVLVVVTSLNERLGTPAVEPTEDHRRTTRSPADGAETGG